LFCLHSAASHPQDIEFTVENKVLYILETRTAKRTAHASVCVAVDMVREKIITEREALVRIDPSQMDYFLHPMLDYQQGEVSPAALRCCSHYSHKATIPFPLLLSVIFRCAVANPQDPAVSESILCKGAPASAGAAIGVLVFSVAEAQLCAASNQPCILLTRETSVDDIAGLRVRNCPRSAGRCC
jgi:pyruvate,orthophosphate dikinase